MPATPYIEVAVATADEDTQELLVALLGAQGYDAFTQEAARLLAYVPADAFDAEALSETLATAGLNPADCAHTEMPDINYNAQWEADYPSVPVGDAFLIYPSFRPPTDTERAQFRTCVEVQPEMSFGTGHHATTRMVLSLLDALLQEEAPLLGKVGHHEAIPPLERGGEGGIAHKHTESIPPQPPLSKGGSILTSPSSVGGGGAGGQGLRVLDFGAGTGVLGIAALLRGAGWADLVDNNEWAVRNAITNLERNGVQSRAAVYEGGLDALPNQDTKYNLILANIDRYVLLQHGPQLREKLHLGGTLIVSGILEVDAEPIIAYFQRSNFTHLPTHRKSEASWLALRFTAQ